MKRILFIIAMAILPIMGFAQNNHEFPDATGCYTLSTDMMGTAIVSYGYFADYGALQRNETEVMGQKVVTLKINGKAYMISPSFREVPSEVSINFDNLTPALIEKYSIKKLGSETLDGRECQVYTFKQNTQGIEGDLKVWIWRGLPLRTEATVMGTTIVSKITEVELGIDLDPSLFELPKK